MKPPATPSSEVTRALQRVAAGELQAYDDLFPLVYRELKSVASNLRRRAQGPVQTTEIVHNAYLRLAGAQIDFEGRRHFFAVAATAMRQVLADEARTRLRLKRGGGVQHLALEEFDRVADGAPLAVEQQAAVVLALHEALRSLEVLEPRWAKVVELRFFGGLEEAETSQLLDVSERTVRRDWVKARAWLRATLAG